MLILLSLEWNPNNEMEIRGERETKHENQNICLSARCLSQASIGLNIYFLCLTKVLQPSGWHWYWHTFFSLYQSLLEYTNPIGILISNFFSVCSFQRNMILLRNYTLENTFFKRSNFIFISQDQMITKINSYFGFFFIFVCSCWHVV